MYFMFQGAAIHQRIHMTGAGGSKEQETLTAVEERVLAMLAVSSYKGWY